MTEPQTRPAFEAGAAGRENPAASSLPGSPLPNLVAVFARAEFQAPVEAILGLVNMLAEDCGTGRMSRDIDKLRQAAVRLEHIVGRLLDPDQSDRRAEGNDLETYSQSLRHDLRTPITAILGYGELLTEEADGHEPQTGILQDVNDAARRILGQIDAMVDFIALDKQDRTSAARQLLEEDASFRQPIEAIRSVLLRRSHEPPRAVGHILVVDDNASTLDLLSRRLARDGHEVVTCEGGEEALNILSDAAFDLVLLDLFMPGISGIEVLRRLKDNPKTARLPVIIFSALDEIDSAVTCIEAGADDYLTKPINPILLRARVAASLERKFLRDRDQAITQELRAEQQRAESLLRNILPKSVIERLRRGETLIADHFTSATILFSDLVGFTALTSHLEPQIVLALLNGIFSDFDRLAADHGLEKIKTIGDAYMVAGGLPEIRSDHASAVAEMALRMPAIVEAVSRDIGRDLAIRIGLHTGPVAAGIIGRNKFIYDVWGDTVNVASRMEHYGEPGRVHVSAETSAALGSAYRVEARDPIDVKGRGVMSTFFFAAAPLTTEYSGPSAGPR